MNVIVVLCDTLRRDHCGPYTGGRALNACWSGEAPPWSIPTPNMERLAARGVVFDNCYNGSTPCMPARRDIYTGRLEFLRRGWGPLEEDDSDLPRLVSGPPNRSIKWSLAQGHKISYFITDHFHMWEQGSGNYHMGYSGFDFVRGCEADAWYTAPVEFDHPEGDRLHKTERHWRNVHHVRRSENDYFCAQVFTRAADWLRQNRTHRDFFLHLDVFDPHEPWDPPEDVLKMFDPKGYDVKGVTASPPYAPWRETLSDEQFNAYRARYAAKVAFLDRQMGRLFDVMDELGLWDDTLLILTTDHGTFNGDHGRIGKGQTHQFDALGHIPFVAAHPRLAHGERRTELVQLVDIFPTVLEAVGKPVPDGIHGKSILPLFEKPDPRFRDYALSGQFGKSVSLTDGEWTLHQSPVPENKPLYWYGYCLGKFIGPELGAVQDNCRRPVIGCDSWPTPTWLANLRDDPNELENLAGKRPDKLLEMQRVLRRELARLDAPSEQAVRLGLTNV